MQALVRRANIDVQIVSEKLSQHVLKNYSAFVSGVNEVASIEQDLQVGAPAERCMFDERAACSRTIEEDGHGAFCTNG